MPRLYYPGPSRRRPELGFKLYCVCVECLIGKQNKPTLFKVTVLSV